MTRRNLTTSQHVAIENRVNEAMTLADNGIAKERIAERINGIFIVLLTIGADTDLIDLASTALRRLEVKAID